MQNVTQSALQDTMQNCNTKRNAECNTKCSDGGGEPAKGKRSWLWELAQCFGMTVMEFAAYTGYTKQRLYQCLQGGRAHLGHLRLAAEQLNRLNERIYNQARAEAREQYLARGKMIDEFLERMGGEA